MLRALWNTTWKSGICSMIGGTLTSLYDFFLDTPPFLILRFNG